MAICGGFLLRDVFFFEITGRERKGKVTGYMHSRLHASHMGHIFQVSEDLPLYTYQLLSYLR